MIRHLRLTLILAALAALLSTVPGCAPKRPVDARLASPEAVWMAFRRNYCVVPPAPGLLAKASLYYTRTTPTRRTNRTLVTLWGDFRGVMRLDLAAGMGKLLAHIREDRDGLLVYYPTEGKAYAHTDPILGATRLGMPFPFSLNELARVIAGDFSGLVPRAPGRGVREGDLFRYVVADALVTAVTLDALGRPVLLEGRTTKVDASARAWTLEINAYGEEPADGKPPLPERLSLALDNGESGVLRIRSRALKLAPWPAKSLDLPLPEGTEFRRLDRGEQPAGDTPVVYEDK
ncbi:MAG: hypothetical protein V3571_14250 [Pseudodesulfovibrio sp.]